MYLIKHFSNSWIVSELQNCEITSLPNGIFATKTRQNYPYALHSYDANTKTEVCRRPSDCLIVCLSVCLSITPLWLICSQIASQ